MAIIGASALDLIRYRFLLQQGTMTFGPSDRVVVDGTYYRWTGSDFQVVPEVGGEEDFQLPLSKDELGQVRSLIGGGAPGGGTNTILQVATTVDPALQLAADRLTSDRRDAAHFLRQATFGPRWDEIQAATNFGSRRLWLRDQFTKNVPKRVLDWVVQDGGGLAATNNFNSANWYFGIQTAAPFRARATWAVLKIIPVSIAGGGLTSTVDATVANYLDRLNERVFTTWADILETVTYSLQMAQMLTYLKNEKANSNGSTQPDENYAREIMQLFTIGLVQLNVDGTPILDSQGVPAPTYTNDDIREVAKVFTGLVSFSTSDAWLTDPARAADIRAAALPSQTATNTALTADTHTRLKHYVPFYETGAKVALGGRINIPADTDPATNIRMFIDQLVRHPSCGPFVARRLIGALVSSNPSPAYVARVATVFRDNGRGVVGDMKSVWEAILCDPEAAFPGTMNPRAGRLKDGFEMFAGHLRSLERVNNAGQWRMTGNAFGTTHVDAYGAMHYPYFPSIFGGYDQIYAEGLPQTYGMLTPEFSGYSDSTLVYSLNQDLSWISGGEERDTPAAGQNRSSYSMLPLTGSASDLIDRVNLLLCGGAMSTALRNECLAVIGTMPTTSQAERNDRASALLTMVVASPAYRVQL